MKRIDIYYFSGTGNTLLVAKKMREVFESKGCVVKLFNIEKEYPEHIEPNNIIGLAFPIAIGTTYPVVMNFIKRMPKVENTNVFMVATMGGLAVGIASYIKSLLIKKGYKTTGAKYIIMPDNFMPSAKKDIKNPKILERGLNKAATYAQNLWDANTNWFSIPIFPSLYYFLSQYIFKLKSFKTSIKVDTEKCVKCGLCAKLCPVNNIVVRDYPVMLGACELCLRCLAFCPAHAIYRKQQGEHRYRAVNHVDITTTTED